MRVQTIRFDDRRRPRPRDKIALGFEGDNLVERLEFILPVIAEAQTAQLMMAGKYANAVLLQRDGEAYYADLTAEIVGTDGEVEAYVQINGSGGEAWHSDVMLLITGALPNVEKEVEQRFPTAVGTMLAEIAGHREERGETLGEAQAAADRAEDAAVNPPIIGDNGHWLLWDFEAGRYIDSGVAAQGPPGQAYTLPPATPDTLGGIMLGNGLVADKDGRTSVEPEGEYELIETIVIPSSDDGVQALVRDKTPEGEDYNFLKIRLITSNAKARPINTWAQLKIWSGNDVAGAFKISGNGETEFGEQVLIAEIKNGHLSIGISGITTNRGNLNAQNSTLWYSGSKVFNGNITKMELSLQNGFGTYDRVEIWGVRANA